MADGLQRPALGGEGVGGAVELVADRRAGLEDLVAEAVPLAEQQQALLQQVLLVDALALGPAVVGRQQHLEGLLVERLGDHVGLGEGQRDDDGVELAAAELAAQVAGEALLDVERHLRRLAGELRHQVGEEVGADGVDGADAQRARQLVAAGGGQLLDHAALLQHALGLLDDLLAQRGDLDGGFRALEQRHAELLLELLDGHRQGRLGDEAALGGATKVALLGQCHDVAEFC